MISLGMAFDLERDYKYLPFMVLIAFVMLMFFLLTISRSNLNRHLKTVFFFLVSLVVAWMGRRDIKLAVYPGIYGFSLYHLVFNKHLLYLFAPEAGSRPMEHGLCSLEVRGQRGGLPERDGTVRSGIKKRYRYHACIWRHPLERLHFGT